MQPDWQSELRIMIVRHIAVYMNQYLHRAMFCHTQVKFQHLVLKFIK